MCISYVVNRESLSGEQGALFEQILLTHNARENGKDRPPRSNREILIGHLICVWISGRPTAMPNARACLVSGGNTPFCEHFGDALLPVMLSALSVIFVYRRTKIPIFCP